ncbi:HVA22-LIKE PROTEIN K [Salix koriyanagi]|uniref:HVA22-like protein n=1 Tax=Salix koriyanagi TaxID=2511006 RepID=A0A9Q0UNB3_9ROSI|nr:HVA22-LIKE PROTEIN K [Salix koriyanagi]
MYWAAYGSFTLAEAFADRLISWFPMYYHMKFAFLVWLQLPSAEVKLISNHQEELKYAKRMLLKVMGSADHMLKDAPNHSEGHPELPAIEEQTRTISDTDSDHAD